MSEGYIVWPVLYCMLVLYCIVLLCIWMNRNIRTYIYVQNWLQLWQISYSCIASKHWESDIAWTSLLYVHYICIVCTRFTYSVSNTAIKFWSVRNPLFLNKIPPYSYIPFRLLFITSLLCPSKIGNSTRSSQSPGASTILSDKNSLMADNMSPFCSALYARLWKISSDIKVAIERPISRYCSSSRGGPSKININRTGSGTSVRLPRWQPFASLTNAIAGFSNSSIVPTITAVASASEGIRPRTSDVVFSSKVGSSATIGSGTNDTPTCFSSCK